MDEVNPGDVERVVQVLVQVESLVRIHEATCPGADRKLDGHRFYGDDSTCWMRTGG